MKNHPFHRRLGFALAGLRDAWRRERSFRTQVGAAAIAVVALCILRPAPVWWAIVALLIAVVLAMELFNSALEALADLVHADQHPQIRIVKDMAAAAVLLVAAAALVIAIALAISLT